MLRAFGAAVPHQHPRGLPSTRAFVSCHPTTSQLKEGAQGALSDTPRSWGLRGKGGIQLTLPQGCTNTTLKYQPPAALVVDCRNELPKNTPDPSSRTYGTLSHLLWLCIAAGYKKCGSAPAECLCGVTPSAGCPVCGCVCVAGQNSLLDRAACKGNHSAAAAAVAAACRRPSNSDLLSSFDCKWPSAPVKVVLNSGR